MKSSDLFSHPYEPEVNANEGDSASSEPVQAPVFSDSPQRNSTASENPNA